MRLSDWQSDYVDGATEQPGVILRLTLPVELVFRCVYCFFDRASILTSATAAPRAAFLIFRLGGVETMRLPVCQVPENNVRFGFAKYAAAHAENQASVAGSVFWNNSDGTNYDYCMHPFYVTAPADECFIDHNFPAAVARNFLGVLSLRTEKI